MNEGTVSVKLVKRDTTEMERRKVEYARSVMKDQCVRIRRDIHGLLGNLEGVENKIKEFDDLIATLS